MVRDMMGKAPWMCDREGGVFFRGVCVMDRREIAHSITPSPSSRRTRKPPPTSSIARKSRCQLCSPYARRPSGRAARKSRASLRHSPHTLHATGSVSEVGVMVRVCTFTCTAYVRTVRTHTRDYCKHTIHHKARPTASLQHRARIHRTKPHPRAMHEPVIGALWYLVLLRAGRVGKLAKEAPWKLAAAVTALAQEATTTTAPNASTAENRRNDAQHGSLARPWLHNRIMVPPRQPGSETGGSCAARLAETSPVSPAAYHIIVARPVFGQAFHCADGAAVLTPPQ